MTVQMRSLNVRVCEPELMDQPGLSPALHHGALRGLSRINRLSRTAEVLWSSIRKLATDVEPSASAPLRVLDVGCGGGDLVLALADRAARARMPVHVSGCDVNDVAIEYAERNAATRQRPVNIFRQDVLNDGLPLGYDVICSSLFLHHLQHENAVALLRQARESGARMILMSDLVRSRWGYCLAWCGVRLLTRSPICRVDGPLSVRAAWSVDEARQLAEEAGLLNAKIDRYWPERFLLRWSRP